MITRDLTAEVVARILGEEAYDLPAARLRPARKVRWLLDAAAAARVNGHPSES